MFLLLKSSGIETYVLSGDREAPTRNLSKELEFDGYFANKLPEEKAAIILVDTDLGLLHKAIKLSHDFEKRQKWLCFVLFFSFISQMLVKNRIL